MVTPLTQGCIQAEAMAAGTGTETCAAAGATGNAYCHADEGAVVPSVAGPWPSAPVMLTWVGVADTASDFTPLIIVATTMIPGKVVTQISKPPNFSSISPSMDNGLGTSIQQACSTQLAILSSTCSLGLF